MGAGTTIAKIITKEIKTAMIVTTLKQAAEIALARAQASFDQNARIRSGRVVHAYDPSEIRLNHRWANYWVIEIAYVPPQGVVMSTTTFMIFVDKNTAEALFERELPK